MAINKVTHYHERSGFTTEGNRAADGLVAYATNGTAMATNEAHAMITVNGTGARGIRARTESSSAVPNAPPRVTNIGPTMIRSDSGVHTDGRGTTAYAVMIA